MKHARIKRLTDEQRETAARNVGIAWRYHRTKTPAGCDQDAALSGAMLGLVHAASTHDPGIAKLSTHAYGRMRHQMTVATHESDPITTPAFTWFGPLAGRPNTKECVDHAHRMRGMSRADDFGFAAATDGDEAERTGVAMDVREAVASLPPAHREIIEALLRDEPASETAGRLGVSHQAVYSARKRARAALQVKLRDYRESA